MKKYPPHHHDYASTTSMRCAICGQPGVTAYMIAGGTEITMSAIRRRWRVLFKI